MSTRRNGSGHSIVCPWLRHDPLKGNSPCGLRPRGGSSALGGQRLLHGLTYVDIWKVPGSDARPR